MNSLNDMSTDHLISKIVEANNAFVIRQNENQEKAEQRYQDEKKEVLSEIKNISSEVVGFKEKFVWLSGEVSQIKESILSEKELKKLTFDCIEVFENKKIAGNIKRQDEITQKFEIEKSFIGNDIKSSEPFYKKAAFIATGVTTGAITTILIVFKFLGWVK